jgi:hypothetical protein
VQSKTRSAGAPKRRASSSVDISAAEWPAMSLSRKRGGDFISHPERSEA